MRRSSYQDGRAAVRPAGCYWVPGPRGRGRVRVDLLTWEGAPVDACAVAVGGVARVVSLDRAAWSAVPTAPACRLTDADRARLKPLPGFYPIAAPALLWAVRAVETGRFAARGPRPLTES